MKTLEQTLMDFCYSKNHPEILERDPTMILLGPFNISGCIFPLVILNNQKTCSQSKHTNREEKCFFPICSRTWPGRKRGNRGNRGKYNLHSKRDKKGLIGKDVFYFSE